MINWHPQLIKLSKMQQANSVWIWEW